MNFDFDFIVGLFFYEHGRCKVLGGFLSEKRAKDYADYLSTDLDTMSSILFVRRDDGSVLFRTQACNPKELWVPFDKAVVYVPEHDHDYPLRVVGSLNELTDNLAFLEN